VYGERYSRRAEEALIDTHSHLLPGVDHGCPDLETAARMAGEAAHSGVTTVVCTPHLQDWNPALVDQAREAIEAVRAAIQAGGIELELLLGFEVDLSVAFGATDAELQDLTIEGSQGAIVLEMPYTGWPVFMESLMFRLATSGFRPVLAHPERNDRIQKSSELLEGCLRAGAVAQATGPSLSGEFGRRPVQTFKRLLFEGNVKLLASDAHAYREDGWTLAPMLAALQTQVDEEGLRTLTQTNPARLLAGEGLKRVVAGGPGSGRPRGLGVRRAR
jgi:protein-tyrosine phosphatase